MEREARCDVLIVGGGLGGCAAALAAASLGTRTILTEATDWVGGQLTSQAVPPDEHRWIERFGCTRTYRELRNRIREIYRRAYPLSAESLADPYLNPGKGWVSRLCCEPRVALLALEEMLLPCIANGSLSVRLCATPYAADVQGDSICSVRFQNARDGSFETVTASIVIDATELGDLLMLGSVEYSVGAEARADTGEPHATEREDPNNQQGVTACLALSYDPVGDHTIEPPSSYAFWNRHVPACWPGPLLSWTTSHPRTREKRTWPLFEHEGDPYCLFNYRRIQHLGSFREGYLAEEATIVNWPQNDYALRPSLAAPGRPEPDRAEFVQESRALSLSLLYWMQTEAPRPDGGVGYPGLRLRGDLLGTSDGLAKALYVRESRRIVAQTRVTELHVSAECNPGLTVAEPFWDSVGVGAYRIDLHPSTSGEDSLDIAALPFTIPLGTLLPVRVRNLIAGCKNIGTTHLSNGCYRLHPVEWNVGEVAGALAAWCIKRQNEPSQVRADPELFESFAKLLDERGIERRWPELGPT